MNPLSPFTYYCRHKGQALLLLALISSLTLGVFVMVGVLSTAVQNASRGRVDLTRMSRILAGQTLGSGAVTQLRANPDVAAVLPENGLTINVPSLWGFGGPRPLLGVMEDDLPLVLETCDLRLREGRLIEPRAAEIVLSEEIARTLDLQVGDAIGHEIDGDRYPAVVTELTLVGILESIPSERTERSRSGQRRSETEPEVQMGFVSYEYLAGHEAYQPRLFNLLIIPRPGCRLAVNDFAASLIDGTGATTSVRLETLERESGVIRRTTSVMGGWYALVGGVVAVAAALVVGMVNRIAIAQRLPELGLLHAAGHEKRSLVRRLVLETATITGIGWAFGLALSVAISLLLNTTLRTAEPVIDPASAVPFLLTLPIPAAVIGWVSVSIRRVLNRLDTVAIIERGKLSMEEAGGKRQEARGRKQGKVRSLRNPLSTWAFHRRHRRRSLALVVATGLMVLGVAFPPFVTTMLIDSAWPLALSYTSHASLISPAHTYQAVDPAVLAQIRSHPAVARVIPVRGAHWSPVSGLTMATDVVPYEMPLPVYAVSEGDLTALLDVYGLYVGEGELVQPRSSQIVLTRALARNRGLRVGDSVGRPVHETDGIPTELTIVGLLDSRAPGLTERRGYRVPAAPRWAAFVSYEFVESHEQYSATPEHALVIPVEGQEAEVEAWLEESIDSPRVMVETFGTGHRFLQTFLQDSMRLLVTAESIMAVVAALALAILNRIFVIQRRDEFGILHAAGHSRTGLIGRTVREGIGIAGAAWVIGIACCLAFLLAAQALVYVPRGLSLNLYNPTPWLFTLPIPIAVVVASAGAIAWALSRLDPVAVIERR